MRAFLAVFGVFAVVAAFIGFSYVSAHNSANSQEQSIKSSYDQSVVILGQYGQTIKEMAQVPGMQAKDLTDIVTGANSARYGNDGVSGVMNWIQEQNPTLDQQTYVQLQREISAGRTRFTDAQQLTRDRVRVYEDNLGSFWTGKMMRMAGFPKINLAQYDIISTEDANTASETKIDTAPIQMR